MISNIVVELPYQAVMAVIMFVCFYYPIGLDANARADNAVHERGGLFFLFVLEFMIFTSTFTHMVIAGIPDAESGGNIANLMFSLTLIFCGVLAPPQALPGFWIFMYRISPFTYLVDGMLSTAIANTRVECAPTEFVEFSAPQGATCRQFLEPYMDEVGGYLQDPEATGTCSFCTYDRTNFFLEQVSSDYSNRWRNFGESFFYYKDWLL